MTTDWDHAHVVAVAFHHRDWNLMLDPLAALDTDLRDRLIAAADRLRDAHLSAAEAVGASRTAVVDPLAASARERRVSQEHAERGLARHGYIIPWRTRILGESVYQAVTERHKARSALVSLLGEAQDLIAQAA